MSIDTKKIDKLENAYQKYLPLVLTRKGKYRYKPSAIYESLLKETEISKENASKITEQVTRFLISAKLKLITAPLIREIVNVHLLKMGLEKCRLQYTRIGIPYYDLEKLFEKKEDGRKIFTNLLRWVILEFRAVKRLIKSKS